MRDAHDSSFCGRSQGGFRLCGGDSWKVAAALSAAVTTTKCIGERPHSQAEPTMQNRTRQTPAALRERGSGGEALLSEKRPLPQKHSLHHNRSLGQLSGEGDGELGENVLVHVEVAVGDDLEGDLRGIFTVQHASRHAAGLLA